MEIPQWALFCAASAVFAVLVLLLVNIRTKRGRSGFLFPLDDPQLIDSLPDGFLGLNNDGTILAVNEAYLSMSGYTRKDLLGKPIEILSGMTAQETFAVCREPSSGCCEITHVTHEGKPLALEISLAKLDHPSFSWLYFCRDITKRKEIECSLSHMRDLFGYVIEHTRSAVAVHDTNLCYLYVSQKYLDEYNIKDGKSIIGRHHYDVIPNLPDKWKQVHQRCLKGEVLSNDDDQYIREDGTVEYTRWECRPWYTTGGAIGGIIIYTEMITKQKRIENALREANEYLEALFMHANGPILVWDSSFTVTRSNTAFEKLIGLPKEQVEGKPLETLFMDMASTQKKALSDTLRQNRALSTAELEFFDAEGRKRTILWNAAPIYGQEDQHMLAVIAQGQDITERKQIEEKNLEQLTELQRWYTVMEQREERVLHLKKEVNEVLKQAGKEIRYPSVEEPPL